MSESPRVVLVTGAGGALGRAYVRRFATAGYAVVAADLGVGLDGQNPHSGPAEEAAAEARALGAEAAACCADIAEPEGAAQAVAAALDRFGRLDAVVNNAGFLRDRTLAKLAPEDFDAVLRVHLSGTAQVSRAALPALRASGTGRLVHTASAAIFGSFGQTNYAAAKLGIIGLSRSLALEEQRSGITSNVVAPFARSRMTDPLLDSVQAPLGPELVAPVVEFLASPQCTLTGETLTVGGGHVARVTLGLTPGWQGPEDRPATHEELAANLDRVLAPEGLAIPDSAADVVLRYMTNS